MSKPRKKKGYIVTFGRQNVPGRMYSTSKVYRTKKAATRAKNRFKRLFANPRVKKAR